MDLVSDVEQDVGAILGFSKEAAHVYHDDASRGLDEPVLSVCVHDDEQYLKECCHKVNRTSARIKTGDIHCVELYKQIVPMKIAPPALSSSVEDVEQADLKVPAAMQQEDDVNASVTGFYRLTLNLNSG